MWYNRAGRNRRVAASDTEQKDATGSTGGVFSFGSIGPKLRVAVSRMTATFRLLRQPAANHGVDGLADRRAGRDGADLESSRICTHRLALSFVAEPQQRHQHEGKGGEGGRYQDQRRQLVME